MSRIIDIIYTLQAVDRHPRGGADVKPGEHASALMIASSIHRLLFRIPSLIRMIGWNE